MDNGAGRVAVIARVARSLQRGSYCGTQRLVRTKAEQRVECPGRPVGLIRARRRGVGKAHGVKDRNSRSRWCSLLEVRTVGPERDTHDIVGCHGAGKGG